MVEVIAFVLAAAVVAAAAGVAAGVIAAAVVAAAVVAAAVVVVELQFVLCFVVGVVPFHNTFSSRTLVVVFAAVAANALPVLNSPKMPNVLPTLLSHLAISRFLPELQKTHPSLTYLQNENSVLPVSVHTPFQTNVWVWA